MAGDIDASDRLVFRDMLDVCQLRGRDSTGVINVNRQMQYGYYKNVGPPAFMFDRKSYAETIETGTHAALVGHCRHKTSGAVSRDNAHPFDFEDEGIIGVHNGTLQNYSKLDGYAYNKVDSEVLFNHLAYNGAENTFNQIEGAWACVWWDDEQETLNFIRNSERTLYFTWSADRRKMYWASEAWMFGAVERKTKLWNGPTDDGKGKYILLEENTLWSFNLAPNAKKGDPVITMLPAKKIAPKERTVGFRGGAGGNAWNGRSILGGSDEEKPWETWNKKTAETHEYDEKTKTYKQKMSYQEWEKVCADKKKGGSVPNPFPKQVDIHKELDDQLPVHLRPRPETLALIQGGKSSTGNSTENSSTTSKNGQELETQSNSTKNGEKNINSQNQQTSTDSQKTNRKDSSDDLFTRLRRTGALLSSKVSFRSVAGMAFITDEITGEEYSEQKVEENTGGICSYCDDPIGDLTEIAQFFGPNKFICTHCTEPSLRSVA